MDFHVKTGQPVVDGMPAFIKNSDGQIVQASGRMTDGDGNINADTKAELQSKVKALTYQLSTGAIRASDLGKSNSEAVRQDKFATLKAAATGSSEQFKIVAEVYGDDVVEVFNRQGFTSQVIARKDVVNGMPYQVPIRRMDVAAFQVMENGNSVAQLLEQDYYYPAPYSLQTLLLISPTELATAGPEFMDKKTQDALQALMVRQDNILRNLLLRTVGSFNAPLSFTTFTPQVLSAGRTQLLANGVPAENMIVAVDIWNDLIADPTFTAWWDPVHKYELIQRGNLGSVLGMNIITDGIRYQTLRVLAPGEVFWLSHPAVVGQRGVYKEIEVQGVDHAALGSALKGAFLHGTESMVVSDRSSVYGVRA